MPVELPTTFGKADYNVVLSLQRLADGVNMLEVRLGTPRDAIVTDAIRQIEEDLRRLSVRVDDLLRRVQALE